MAHVVVLDSINEDIFVCGFCKTVFNCIQAFWDHKKYQCKIKTLETTLPNDNILKSDNIAKPRSQESVSLLPSQSEILTANETWVNNVSCRLCRRTFKKMKSLLTHQKTHIESPYQCTVCGRCFVQNSHLQRHIMSHKVWPNGLSETTPKSLEVELLSYSCCYCDLILTNYSQFRAHLKNHLSMKKFKCIQGECSSLFDTIDNLLDHISTTHQFPLYTCHICSKSFRSLEEIAKHYQNHKECEKYVTHMSQTKQYKCSQCDATFKKKENLSFHMLTENHKKTCIHCNKIFTSDKRLRLHLQIHRNCKPFKCNICGSSFNMKKYLSSHMLKHGEKRFSCTVCKYKFKRQDLLQRHMKLHLKRKLFKCPFQDTLECKMEFSRSDKLKLHVKNHTKNMSFCSKSNKTSQQINSGTLEICIIPLDNNRIS